MADVQTALEAPQTQGAGLAVAPAPWVQARPVKGAHRQLQYELQERLDSYWFKKSREER